MFRSGFIAVVGKPNAGKSTLINKLVGFKVAITTPKPQTTRFNIKGIRTTKTSQMIFTDTPGIHLPKNKLGKYMMQGVERAIESVDMLVYLVDASKPKIDLASEKIMKEIIVSKIPTMLVINKVDKVQKEKILKMIKEYDDYFRQLGGSFLEIIPISVYKEDGLNLFISNLEKYLPEGDLIYAEDEITDLTEKEIVEEIIREKALNYLDEEVPHGIKVEVEKFKKRRTQKKEKIYDIEVTILCEKKSHKGILIGKEGAMLKKIGSSARLEIEKMLEDKVNLKLWVKVRENWQENELYLKDIKNKL